MKPLLEKGNRMCMKQWDASYSDLLELFATPTLADRRKYLSLCVMYTIVHNQVHFQPNVFVPRYLSALRSSQNCQFIQPSLNPMHSSTHLYHLHVLNGMTSLLMSHSLLYCLPLNTHFLVTYKSNHIVMYRVYFTLA